MVASIERGLPEFAAHQPCKLPLVPLRGPSGIERGLPEFAAHQPCRLPPGPRIWTKHFVQVPDPRVPGSISPLSRVRLELEFPGPRVRWGFFSDFLRSWFDSVRFGSILVSNLVLIGFPRESLVPGS